MFTTNWSVILIFIVATSLLLLLVLLVRAFFYEVKQWTLQKIAYFKSTIHSLHRKYGAVWSIVKKIHGSELSYSTDIIFQLFSHFYEINQNELEHWGFDKHCFPEGRRDMSDVYRWIKKTRPDNYAEANNVVQSNGHLEYWGVPYKGFKFRINSKGELVITPHDDDSKFVFERVTMRMYNALYHLDTERCLWILERRKFFGF